MSYFMNKIFFRKFHLYKILYCIYTFITKDMIIHFFTQNNVLLLLIFFFITYFFVIHLLIYDTMPVLHHKEAYIIATQCNTFF